jgi:hypothetical protein
VNHLPLLFGQRALGVPALLGLLYFPPVGFALLPKGVPQSRTPDRHEDRHHGHSDRRPAADPLQGALPGADGPGLDGCPFPESAQVLSQVGGAGIALLGFLAQTFQANRRQIVGHLRPQAGWGRWLFMDHLPQRVKRCRSLERRPACEQAICLRAQAINVTARVQVPLARGLFRRPEGGRAGDVSLLREPGIVGMAALRAH